MKGVYRVYDNKNLIAEFPNVLTNRGKRAIGSFLADRRASWGDVMSIGSGQSSPVASNTSLDMEFWREEVDLKDYLAGTVNKLVLRSTIPASVSGKIYEIGIYCTSTPDDILRRGPVVSAFDLNFESWSSGSADEDDFRVGTSSLVLSASETSRADYDGDFRAYTSATKFKLAYIAETGITDISIKFGSNDENFREYSFSPDVLDAYATKTWSLQDFDITGNPNWNEISYIEVSASGAGDVMFDALIATEDRPDDFITVLVSRALVNVDGNNYILKLPDRELQIEYLIDLGV